VAFAPHLGDRTINVIPSKRSAARNLIAATTVVFHQERLGR